MTGYTLFGLEVTDELRGRTFAFLQTMVRVTLSLVLVIAPLVAATVGRHQLRFTDDTLFTLNGAAVTLLVFGLLAAALGAVSYRQMDDRPGIPLTSDLANLARGRRDAK